MKNILKRQGSLAKIKRKYGKTYFQPSDSMKLDWKILLLFSVQGLMVNLFFIPYCQRAFSNTIESLALNHPGSSWRQDPRLPLSFHFSCVCTQSVFCSVLLALLTFLQLVFIAFLSHLCLHTILLSSRA